MTVRIMVEVEDSYRMDEYAMAWNGRKLSETTHRQKMMVEKAFAFHDQSNKQMFLLKFPLLFQSARIVAVI